MVPQLSVLSLALCHKALVGGGNHLLRYKRYVYIFLIRSIDPRLHSTIMRTYAQQTISTGRLRVQPSPHARYACLPKTIYARSSPFTLSLCSITNSRLSLNVLLGPRQHIRVNAHPCLCSEHALR